MTTPTQQSAAPGDYADGLARKWTAARARRLWDRGTKTYSVSTDIEGAVREALAKAAEVAYGAATAKPSADGTAWVDVTGDEHAVAARDAIRALGARP